MTITPAQFREAYEKVTREHLAALLVSWTSGARYTSVITNKVLPAIAETLGCERHGEYQRIDYVLTDATESVVVPSKNDVVVAIEHENLPIGSEVEVEKLYNFDAPLGVLITYIKMNNLKSQFAVYESRIAALSQHLSVPRKGAVLLIVGPGGVTIPSKLEWQYFLLDEQGKFQPLP